MLFISQFYKKKGQNHSILIGRTRNNIHIVIMIQMLIIGLIKSMIKFWGEEGGVVEVLSLHLIIFINLKIAFFFYL